MGNKILTDTSILVGIQFNDESIKQYIPIYQDRLIVPRVAANEFIHGSRNRREQELNEGFLSDLTIIEINEAISLLSYELTSTYCLKVKFGIADALIAATALELNIPLWTVNSKHFKPIKGLTLFKP